MQSLVEHSGLSIKVSDVLGYCVCVKCRGAKTQWRTVYRNPLYGVGGGVLHSVIQEEWCHACYGEGFWKELDELDGTQTDSPYALESSANNEAMNK